jgi:hypothetical protein
MGTAGAFSPTCMFSGWGRLQRCFAFTCNRINDRNALTCTLSRRLPTLLII